MFGICVSSTPVLADHIHDENHGLSQNNRSGHHNQPYNDNESYVSRMFQNSPIVVFESSRQSRLHSRGQEQSETRFSRQRQYIRATPNGNPYRSKWGLVCRDYQAFDQFPGDAKDGDSYGTACKINDGSWRRIEGSR